MYAHSEEEIESRKGTQYQDGSLLLVLKMEGDTAERLLKTESDLRLTSTEKTRDLSPTTTRK